MNALTLKIKSWRSRVEYQGFILGAICAVVTSLLLIGQQQTYLPIQQRLQEDLQKTIAQVLPRHFYDNEPFRESVSLEDEKLSKNPVDVYLAKKEGQVTAVAFQIETEGYGGTITLMIALNTEGEILGLRTLTHKETPGLADKIEMSKSDWMTKFNGTSLKNTTPKLWAVKKDGGKFDQFTGATITPRAIVNGVVNGLEFYARNAQALIKNQQEALTK